MSGPETWRPIDGFDGYEASDLGRVRGWRTNRGAIGTKPRILRQKLAWNGYMQVGLYRDRKQHWLLVARVVLLAFRGPPPAINMDGAHDNGVRADNRLANLLWKTKVENQEDRRRHGTLPMGDRHPLRKNPGLAVRGECHAHAKLTEQKVEMILVSTEPNARLAAELGVSPSLVGHLRNGRGWKHVRDRLAAQRAAS